MRQILLVALPMIGALTLATHAGASTVNWGLGGDGNVSATGTLTFGSDPNAGPAFGNKSKNVVAVSSPYTGFVGIADPQSASLITNVTGAFSDKALGFSNVAITGLVANNYLPHFAPDWTIPYSFSYYQSVPGNPGTWVSYDNLFYTNGSSPQTCTLPPPGDYGGYFDNYGVMFTLANGDVVDLYSNGDTLAVSSDPNQPAPPLSPAPYFYGVVVVSSGGVDNYASASGLAFATPEPSTWAMLGLGFAALGVVGCRKARRTRALAA